jgi:hypothetical protein
MNPPFDELGVGATTGAIECSEEGAVASFLYFGSLVPGSCPRGRDGPTWPRKRLEVESRWPQAVACAETGRIQEGTN